MQLETKHHEMKQLSREMGIIKERSKQLEEEAKHISEARVETETFITADTNRKKTLQKNLNRHNKEINDATFDRKKLLHSIQGIEGNIKELQNQISGMTK